MQAGLVSLGYAAVDGESCPECDSTIDFQRLQFDHNSESDQLTAVYICKCGADFEIEINDRDEIIQAVFKQAGEEISAVKTQRGVLERKSSRIHPIMKAIDELVAAQGILQENWDVFDHASKQAYQWAQDELEIRDMERSFGKPVNISIDKSTNPSGYHTAIHNYLSSTYTYTQVIESQKSHLIRNKELNEQYSNFISDSVVIKGLRIFSQHEQIIPISFQLNRDSTNERLLDFTVEVNEVDSLPSQISQDRPSGYVEGSDQYYSDVEGERINLSQEFAEFHHEGLQLATSILETILREEPEAIEEYESINTSGKGLLDDGLE